ncbi:hypothetical protein V6N12_007986 [Hibiscus sabdariffa]|uniref:Uncharacterized protein n=1 Tax=Hibiscus sabdariffa TaxID=183260 RepID=A0ABR2BSI6_9ROSI
MDASSGNDDNGSNGPDSVHFGWNNDMVDEETYEAQENSENKIQDTNEEAENEENKADENAVNENEADGIGDNEADGADEYVGSYETDSDGDFVSRKTTKIRIVPKLRLLDMTRLGREELNVELNKQLCSRAKKWAEEKIKGNITHEFNRLFDYVLALRTVDPNGSFDLVAERPTAADIPKFRRFYVCFGALKEGFKRTCPKKQQAKVQNHADQPPPMPTSIEPSSPSHSIGPSAPQPSNTPYSPPHSTRPAATPMVFMPTPSVQQSFAFDSTSPPAQLLVIKKTVFSPKRKVTANRSAATVSVPKEAIPSQLTI